MIPARNSYHPIIANLAVLPQHRGNRYIDGILSEGTRVLADAGVDHIRASTDLGNTSGSSTDTRASSEGEGEVSAVLPDIVMR